MPFGESTIISTLTDKHKGKNNSFSQMKTVKVQMSYISIFELTYEAWTLWDINALLNVTKRVISATRVKIHFLKESTSHIISKYGKTHKIHYQCIDFEKSSSKVTQ